MNTHKVSILIPIYNSEMYIERCAKSLFSQTVDDIEFIFVNDCTKDNSIVKLEKIIHDYPLRKKSIKIINHEKNAGVAVARNTAIDNSSGQYIMFVDSDDWLSSEIVVEELLNIVNKTGVDIVAFDFKNIYPGKEILSHKAIPNNKEDYLKLIIECKCSASLNTAFYNRKLFKYNHTRCIPNLNIGEDYLLKSILVYYSEKILYVDKPYYCYLRANENSIMNNYKLPIDTPELNELQHFLSQQNDYRIYQVSLKNAKLHKHAWCFVNWAKYSGDKNVYKKIPPIIGFKWLLNNGLTFKCKIILLVNKLHLSSLFKFLIQIKIHRLNNL